MLPGCSRRELICDLSPRSCAGEGFLRGEEEPVLLGNVSRNRDSLRGQMKPSNVRLVIVSNRLPFTVSIVDGKPKYSVSSGGLTTGLWSYLQHFSRKGRELEFLWVGWPGCSVPPECE